MKKRNPLVVSTLVMALVLSLAAVSAWGRGFGRGGPGGRGGFPGEPGFGPGPGGPRGGGLVLRLLFPCKGDCFDAARTCFEATETTALGCAQSTCDAEITAARSACTTDLSTDDCRTARIALVTCLEPCLDAKRTALTACHTTADTCADACAE
jgi:hypothetical protein